MPRPPDIAVVEIDGSVEHKIRNRSRGSCTGDEVREALVMRDDFDRRWDDHPEHGRRLVALGRTYEGREIIAWLLPLGPEGSSTWKLKTARAL